MVPYMSLATTKNYMRSNNPPWSTQSPRSERHRPRTEYGSRIAAECRRRVGGSRDRNVPCKSPNTNNVPSAERPNTDAPGPRASNAWWVECRRRVGGSRDGRVPCNSQNAGDVSAAEGTGTSLAMLRAPARVTRGGLNAGAVSSAEGTGTSLVNDQNAGDLSSAEGTGTSLVMIGK